MKKVFFISFLFIFSNLAITQTTWLSLDERNEQMPPVMVFEDNGTGGFSIDYTFNGVWVSNIKVDKVNYQFISIPGFGKLGDVGKPALPMRNYPIAVPIGAEVNIDIIRSEYKIFEGYLVHPALEPAYDSIDEEEPRFVLDEDFYKEDVFYPEDVVSADNIKIMRGLHFTYIRFCPVQYNPAKKELRVYSHLEVKVSFMGGNSFIDANQYSKDFARVFKNFVINGDNIKTPGLLYKSMSSEIDTTMLIITHSNFSEAANKLAAWNTRKGNKAIVKTTAQIGSTSDAIKQYVQDMYQNLTPKPEYLILLGDDDYVVSERYPGSTVSDLRYVCMDGYDDIYPEMAYGRISVASASNANKVVDKIIAYETVPPTDANFYSNGLSAGYFQDGDPNNNYAGRDGYADRRFAQTSEEQRVYLNNLGYNFEMCYFAGDPVDPTNWNNGTYSWGEEIPDYLKKPNYAWDGDATQISNAINNGCFLVLHRDHGSVTAWGEPNYTTTDINNLTNGEKQPVVFSINCLTGSFQSNCFCEAFLRHENGGCVGIIGPTGGTSSGPNDALSEGMVDAIWPGLVPSFPHNPDPTVTPHDPIYKMGHVINQGKLRMEETWQDYWGNDERHFRIYHYFGDPSMEIWTEIPSQFTNVSIMDDGDIVYVSADEGGCDITASSGDNGASYHEVVHNVSGTGFETPVRPLYITVTKHNYIPYTAVTGGTFTSNETWFGNLNMLGNVYVSSGITLTINPGTTIKFDSGKKLTVNGTLDAQGTSTNHIVFTSNSSTPSAGDWYGIRFENSSVDDECIIKNCEIEYASYGIYCSSANPSIENNTILNNHKGIFLGASSPSIKSNKINDNNFGILGEFSNPHINNNKIINNYYDGVCLEYASFPKFYNNTITNNGCGTYFNYYCDPRFGPSSGSGKGYNIIANNRNGIIAVYNSYPFLGSTGPYNQRVGGYNSIYSNNNYNAYADIGTHIEAEYNWWDNQFYKIGYGGGSSVDYIPYLYSDPGGGSSLGKGTFIAGDNFNDDEYGDFNPKKPNINRLSDLWLWANELWLTDQLHEAINVYRILIRKFSETSEARHALVKVLHLYEETEMEGLSSYLNSLINSKNMDPELKQIAFDLLVGAYLRDVDINKAIHTCDKILHKYPDTESEKLALFHLVFIYNSNLEDMETTQIYLQIMKQKYPYDKLTLIACDEMGEEVDWSLAKRGYTLPPEEDKPEIPEKFALSDNYPNPFNPITTIAFDLPEVADVILTIYDITGRKIVTLINDHFNTGYHKVMWNGRNEAGNLVSSGIYLYHIHTLTGFNGTKKMVLVR